MNKIAVVMNVTRVKVRVKKCMHTKKVRVKKCMHTKKVRVKKC